ncbi:MAG TPA: FtsX-like permease family protein [Steroidobacteraceae bacterium]|jgi:putative ABC transport system permease protein|nr:FtsX-like permease family protein [Steroidobacteraceae bacterium]
MKYLPLLWSALWRRKARTIFTMLSIVVAFLLFGMLETVDYAFANPDSGAVGADRLITTNRTSITLSLPFSDTQQIRSLPGVKEVTWLTWFGGYYQEAKNFIFAMPVDIDSYINVHRDEISIKDDELQKYRQMRTAALVNTALMKQYGWKVGDKLPLHSTIWTRKDDGSLNWVFDIVGTFASTDKSQAQTVLFHYEYFDEGRGFGKGNVGWFEERIDQPSQAAVMAERIDALFANSSNETKTQPAKDFLIAFIKQRGDIGFVLRAILGAVFFSLLLLTANTLMQSMRERTSELAVLKTLGFKDAQVFALLVGESLFLFVSAAVVGLALSYGLLPVIKDALQGIDLSGGMFIPGIVLAVALAIIVGLPPALRAKRLKIVDALADKR